ncbi:hypothetical protein P4V43_08275 [Brevibacillus fortis]|nr:hypothetical protein [Brevibacillus fortis]
MRILHLVGKERLASMDQHIAVVVLVVVVVVLVVVLASGRE